MTTVLLCLCGCVKPDHVQGRKACKKCGVCSRFELDGEVARAERTRVLTAVAEVCEDQAGRARAELDGLNPAPKHSAEGPTRAIRSGERVTLEPGGELQNLAGFLLPGGESTSAKLRQVEGELVRAEAERDDYQEHLVAMELERDRARSDIKELTRELDATAQARDLAQAELVTARLELDAVRTARDNLDRELGGARKQLADIEDGIDRRRIHELAQELNTERARADRAAADVTICRNTHGGVVLYAYDAWSCLAESGCGSRYVGNDPTHPCGPLTPVRVTIARK